MIMRSPWDFSLLDPTLLTGVPLCLFVSAAGPALAATSQPFTFENADIDMTLGGGGNAAGPGLGTAFRRPR